MVCCYPYGVVGMQHICWNAICISLLATLPHSINRNIIAISAVFMAGIEKNGWHQSYTYQLRNYVLKIYNENCIRIFKYYEMSSFFSYNGTYRYTDRQKCLKCYNSCKLVVKRIFIIHKNLITQTEATDL